MYLDPGFGSMAIQLIVAGFAAVGAYLFIIRNKIAQFFKKKKGGDAEAGTEQPDKGMGSE